MSTDIPDYFLDILSDENAFSEQRNSNLEHIHSILTNEELVFKSYYENTSEIPKQLLDSIKTWEINKKLFLALNKLKFLEDFSIKKLKDISILLIGYKEWNIVDSLANEWLLYNEYYSEVVLREILQYSKVLEQGRIENIDESLAKELLSLEVSREFIEDNFNSENLSKLPLDDYITLLQKAPMWFITHVTRHGYRDRTSHHNYSWDKSFNNWASEILTSWVINSIHEQDIAWNYTLDSVEKSMKRILAKKPSRVEDFLHKAINSNIKSELADANAVHWAIDHVADDFYWCEKWNSIFMIYPTSFIASQYKSTHQNWNIPNNFHEDGESKNHDKNDVWMMWKDTNRWILPLDAWIIFIPKNTRVDSNTWSKYKLDNNWNVTTNVFEANEWISSEKYWKSFFTATWKEPSKIIFYEEKEPNEALDSFCTKNELYSLLWYNINLTDMFSENMITQQEMRNLLETEVTQYEEISKQILH